MEPATNGVSDRKTVADACKTQWEKLGSWFIGPSSENIDEFSELAIETFRQNVGIQSKSPADRTFITSKMKSSVNFRTEMAKLKKELEFLNDELRESIPFSSVRYQGHVIPDPTMSAKLGFLSAWMTNANNASSEVGPVTTRLEIEVGKQLCDLLGFAGTHNPRGYITNGGTSANIEALWSSRNVKFLPLAVRKAIQDEPMLYDAENLSVYIPRLDRKQKITYASDWDLLNLNLDDIVALPGELQRLIRKPDDSKDAISRYSIAHNGLVNFYEMHDLKTAPMIIASPSNHFSWGKAATLLGIGGCNLMSVAPDRRARMDIVALRKLLDKCLADRIPLVAVICVIGTTEHGAVDPIADVLKLRAEYKTKGLNFCLLADGAWGGYFTTILRRKHINDELLPKFPMSNYVRKQLNNLKYADTVTIDPHKSGYCPFPAGGLCYRNGQMKSSLAFDTDVVFTEDITASNCYGLETSKPGAASAGVYLTHKVIGLNSSGYGRILGQALLGAKLFYCAWLTAANQDDGFVCIPLIPIPKGFDFDEESAKQFIRDRVICKSYEDLLSDSEVGNFLSEIGPDVAINAFAVNIKGNTSAEICNRLNVAIYHRLSHREPNRKSVCDVPLFLTKSSLSLTDYVKISEIFKIRLGISPESKGSLTILRNTVTNSWTAADQTIPILVQQFRHVVVQCITEIMKC
ncbi:L-tyrosine decarboxylase-like [Ylistrum balloti]|uniref:L-tyrosine decarboxylase-like n=1 Tax=Ylistrum balloti TaxID=509963 RepID=UPI002905E1CE|nr:L-tyrosine decarboxylase-like [Ylistrum balloti]